MNQSKNPTPISSAAATAYPANARARGNAPRRSEMVAVEIMNTAPARVANANSTV